MISVKREILSAVGLCGVVACSGPTDPRESIDVNVLADLKSDHTAPVTVQNNSDDIIIWTSSCGGGRERRAWRNLWNDAIPELCHYIDLVLTSDTIQPGEEHTRDDAGSVEHWEPGEYRFKPNLFDRDGEMLPDEIRTSNSFRIED